MIFPFIAYKKRNDLQTRGSIKCYNDKNKTTKKHHQHGKKEMEHKMTKSELNKRKQFRN